MPEKPLKNKTIVITRAPAQAGEFADMLTALGARVISVPVIRITPLESRKLEKALQSVNSYDWIIFTSVNGVDIFFSRLREIASSPELRPAVCAIGPGTADRIVKIGFQVALVPELYQAEGLLEIFSAGSNEISPGQSILIPRARQARDILPEKLKDMGFKVDVVPVYKTDYPANEARALRETLLSSAPDMITFTSSSTVTNFLKLAGKHLDLENYRFASIGPITTETAARAGIKIDVQPEESTLESMAREIARYYRDNPDPGHGK